MWISNIGYKLEKIYKSIYYRRFIWSWIFFLFFFWSLKQCFISIFGILVCDLCVSFIGVTNKKTHQSHIRTPIIHTNIHARYGSEIFQRDKRMRKINKTLTQKYQNFYELEIRWY